MNELITNAMKHALWDRQSNRSQTNVMKSSYGNDGQGLPSGMDWKNSGSMGLQFASWLVQLLGGSLIVSSDKGGTSFRITFSRSDRIRQ